MAALAEANTVWRRLKALVKRKQLDRDLEDELAHHLEMRAQKNREIGMDAEEARYAARRRLGNTTSLKERSRELWAFATLETLWQDLRYGARMLRKNPSFAAVAVLTLSLGVGANTALFSVIKSVLLNALPYREPDRLVAVARGDSQNPHPTNVSFGEVADWKARSHAFQDIALSRGWTPASSGNGAPEIVYGLRVTRNFFDVLGAAPYLGRGFSPEEDRPEHWHVVMLSYPYWVRRFAANPKIVGQTIWLDQVPFQIVGVLPKSFEPLSFTDAGGAPEVWAPLGYDLSIPQAGRSWQHLQAVARLSDAVSLGQARAEMNSVATNLAREFPKDYPPDSMVTIVPLRESWYGKISTALWLLFGATAVILLIACANVANLLLAQAAKKRREVALRSALGASRLRIVRLLLTESTLISVLGGAGGVLLALWGTALLIRWIPADLPRISVVRLDPLVLLFTVIIATGTGILTGLVPALETSRADQMEAMQQTSRGVKGEPRSRGRNLLVSSQVCLAFVLMVASGLMLKSFVRVWKVNPGFKAENLYEVNFSLAGPKYHDDKIALSAQKEILERVSHIPGVQSASLVSTPPIAGSFGSFDQTGFVIQDRYVPDPEVPSVDRYYVSPEYFETTGIPLRRGRLFSQADAGSSNLVAIISEAAARQIFPGENPLGKRIQLGGRHDDRPWAEIVGIVGDVHQYGLDSPVTPQAYVLYTQDPSNYATVLLVRSTVGSAALTRAIEERIWAIDKNTVMFNPFWMRQILSGSLTSRRFTMSLLAGFGGLAVILGAIGIYGVMSYTVAQRTSEIGIRMALGAQPSDMMTLVSGEGMLRAGLGLLAGLLVAAALTRVLSTQLFGVSPLDAVTFGSVSLLLAAVAFVACYVPARRASRVDAMTALRHE